MVVGSIHMSGCGTIPVWDDIGTSNVIDGALIISDFITISKF